MSAARRQGFPADNRIRKRQDFIRARNAGRRFRTAHFYIHVLENSSGRSRLGVTVSRRIGHAVCRNRIKRLVREFFRQNYGQIVSGLDVSVVAHRRPGLISLDAVTEELQILFGISHRSGLE